MIIRYDVFLIWARWIIIFSAECLIFDNVDYIYDVGEQPSALHCQWSLKMIIKYDVFLIYGWILYFLSSELILEIMLIIYVGEQPSVLHRGLLTIITRKIYYFYYYYYYYYYLIIIYLYIYLLLFYYIFLIWVIIFGFSVEIYDIGEQPSARTGLLAMITKDDY